MRTSIYKEVDTFRTGAFYTHGSSTSPLNVSGLFRKRAFRHLERCREQKSQEWGECFVKFATGETDSKPLSFMAQLDRRKNGQNIEGHDPGIQPSIESIVCIEETTDQILSKLVPFMRTTILHPDYREPPLLSGQTFGAVVGSEVRRICDL